MTSSELQQLRVGDRIIRTNASGPESTGTVIEGQAPSDKHLYVKWDDTGATGIVDKTVDNDRIRRV